MAIFSRIELSNLELNVYLGWEDKERSTSQTIFLDIHLSFPAPPLACQTDDLKDTYCYDDLTTNIKNRCASRSFHLIEYLAAELYDFIKSNVASDILLTLCLTKKTPTAHLAYARMWYGDQKDL